MKNNLIILLIACISCTGLKPPKGDSAVQKAVDGPQDVYEFQNFIDSFISKELKRENIPGAAFVFVKDGKIFYSQGYGIADIQKNTTVDPAKTIFRIGSISKVFTADALLQLVSKNKISMNENVNTYLKTVKVPATFSKPVTVSDILTHRAGLDEIRPGTQAADSADVLPLDQFLKDKMVRLWPPGEIIMYSTYGITLGGLIIEEVLGQAFEKYLLQNIWQPLQMPNTNINVPKEKSGHLAMGYENENGTNVPQRWEWYHTTPASSVNSTAEDMAHWIIAHLDHGKFENNELMPAAMMNEMLKHQASMHPKMYGVAYGFFEEYFNGLRFLHHGGNMAGFNSLAVLIPEKNAGFFFVSQHEASSVRDNLQWAILDRYYKDTTLLTVPSVSVMEPNRAKLFAGKYKQNTYCHTCGTQSRTAIFTVSANSDGTIQLNNRKWIESKDKLLFIREDGRSRIGFRADSSGKITHMYFGGFWNFEKIE